MIKKHVIGMKKKQLNKHGAYVLYKEIFLLNIIIVCFILKKRNL